MLEDEGGGFLPEESSGGFVVDEPAVLEVQDDGFIAEDPDLSTEITHIPLSLVPTALQILDLPPDDEQVLSVFRNAASGWSNSRRPEEAELVSKKDWRAVCAVLLAPQAAHEEDVEESDGGSGEEYVDEDRDSDSAAGEDMEDDDDADVPQKKTRRTRGQPTHQSSDEELPTIRPITTRQKEASREAFSLFFPDVPESKLNSQKITVADLVRVAKELKEKLTYDQIMEMLSSISTSADKSSVSLSDFEKLMVKAKLA